MKYLTTVQIWHKVRSDPRRNVTEGEIREMVKCEEEENVKYVKKWNMTVGEMWQNVICD